MIPFGLAPILADAIERVACPLSTTEHAALVAGLRDLPDDAHLEAVVEVWSAEVLHARVTTYGRALIDPSLSLDELVALARAADEAARVSEADILDAVAHALTEHERGVGRLDLTGVKP